MSQKETKQLIFQRDYLKKNNNKQNRLECLPGLTSRQVLLFRTRLQRTLPEGFRLSAARWSKTTSQTCSLGISIARKLPWRWVVTME